MQGYKGQHEGLRATLYLELLPGEWFPINNPFLSSESNTLGLTHPVTTEVVAASRFRPEEKKKAKKNAPKETEGGSSTQTVFFVTFVREKNTIGDGDPG